MKVEGLPKFLAKGYHRAYNSPKASYLVLDVETSAHFDGPVDPRSYLVLSCWTIYRPGKEPEEKYAFGNEFEMQELVRDIRSVDFIIAQNLKHELQWLKRMGMDLRDVFGYCTMLGQWVLDGNETKPRSLDGMAIRYGLPRKSDLIAKLWAAGVRTEDIPRPWLLDYCKLDVDLCHWIFQLQLPQLEENRQFHLAYVRNLTAACLADIEFAGMTLDKQRVADEYNRVIQERDRALDELRLLAGSTNLGSNKQLGILLYDQLGFRVPKDRRGKDLLTASGARPTNSAALGLLVPETEDQRSFLDSYRRYNKLDSLLTKNLEFFKGVCDEYDGVFYGSLNQNRVKSHRLASTGRPIKFKDKKKAKGAQFQNLPREYKKLFWSGDEDYLIGEADGSQLEFRVAADMGSDMTAITEIINEVDIHTNTAQVFLDSGTQPEFIGLTLKEARQPAKPQTFKPLYGGRGNTEAEKAYCEFFKDKYSGIEDTQRGWTMRVANDKEFRTPYGMIFRWPDAKMNRWGVLNYATQVYNFPVQGFATGEIIPIALVLFWHLCRDKDVLILNTIHDSIIARVHKDAVEWYEETVRLCLTEYVFEFLREFYDYEFQTPLGCGIKLSRNWGDTNREVTYNVFPDGHFTRKVKE